MQNHYSDDVKMGCTLGTHEDSLNAYKIVAGKNEEKT
jgi:hypothetical protein